MAGKLITCMIFFGTAAVFCTVAQWALRRSDPMPFWAGTEVDPALVADIHGHNRAHARMWARYSLWYWAAGLLALVSPIASLIAAGLGCSAGFALLVRAYRRIERTYIRR